MIDELIKEYCEQQGITSENGCYKVYPKKFLKGFYKFIKDHIKMKVKIVLEE